MPRVEYLDIELLNAEHHRSSGSPDRPLPLEVIFQLPHLRRLDLVDGADGPDLSVIESLANAGQLVSLESLTLQLSFLSSSVPYLAHFHQLKELTLKDDAFLRRVSEYTWHSNWIASTALCSSSA
jgi:hypothetical protein